MGAWRASSVIRPTPGHWVWHSDCVTVRALLMSEIHLTPSAFPKLTAPVCPALFLVSHVEALRGKVEWTLDCQSYRLEGRVITHYRGCLQRELSP
jgi:hypothetical protein